MNEPALELRRTVSLLRRRWWLMAIFGLLGAGAGLLVSAAQSEVYVAESSVLLPQSPVDSSGNLLRNMQTEASIATGAEVLSRAGEAVDPAVPAVELEDRVRAEAVTLDILEVRVEAEVPRDAALLADAVAEAYVEVANSRVADRTDTFVGALERQASSLDAQIQRLEADIVAATERLFAAGESAAEGDREAALIDALRTEQVEAARQLSSVTGRIADARLEEELARRGTQVLQRALVPSAPTEPRPVRNALVGLVLGVGASAAWVLVRGSGVGRLRYRDDIALAAGAPVVGSLDVSRRYSTSDCRRLLERWEPDALTKQSVRQALGRVGFVPGSRTRLEVVSLPGDDAAPLLALQLAVVVASLGIDTRLVVATTHGTARRVRAACTGRSPAPTRAHLWVEADPPSAETRKADLTVAVEVAGDASFERATSGDHRLTTLAVSSGRATANEVADAALTCHDAGHPLGGVLVANPDPADRTPAGLFAASAAGDDDERSRSLAASPRTASWYSVVRPPDGNGEPVPGGLTEGDEVATPGGGGRPLPP